MSRKVTTRRGRPVTRRRCNCGAKGIVEYLIVNGKTAWTMDYCGKCEPKGADKNITKIYDIKK